MKRILFFLLFSQITFPGFSQIEFAPVGAEWYYDYTPAGFPGNGYVRIYCEGDTTIMNQACKKLIVTRVNYNEQIHHTDTSYLDNEFLFDDEGKVSVFRYGQFQPLFDFTSTSGSIWTIPASHPDFACDSFDE